MRPLPWLVPIYLCIFLFGSSVRHAATAAVTSINCSISQNEYSALQSLFDATEGSNWNWRLYAEFGMPWNFTAANSSSVENLYGPCVDCWQGLTCAQNPSDDSLCSVEIVALGDYGLRGFLPSELGYLSGLDKLDLSYNCLYGTIPMELGMLTGLQYLYLRANDLTGSISVGITALISLVWIDLRNTKLTGSVPAEIGSLTAMQYLYLSQNHFSGNISVGITVLFHLIELHLGLNDLTGSVPSELGLLTLLRYLDVSTNKLTGSVPNEVGNLRTLYYLGMSGNSLTGSLPCEIGLLTALQYLYLFRNLFTGNISVEITAISGLVQLYLGINDLTGSVPCEIGLLTSLRYLDLSSNQLIGSIPDEVGSMTALHFLDMSGNSLTGSIPREIKMLSRLEHLVMSDNRLTGTIAPFMLRIINFEAASNILKGPLPTITLSSCEYLCLANNKLTGSVASFNSLAFPNLSTLLIADNGFSKQLPAEIFSLPALETLDASGNCFSGKLAFPVFTTASILALNELSSGSSCRIKFLPRSLLNKNPGYYPHRYMTGTIPSNIWLQSGLLSLYLAGNGFSGPIIPDNSFSFPPRLVNLSLALNFLTGTVPTILQGHKKFELVDLSNNRLTGTIESSFISRTDRVPTLAVNRFSGKLSFSLNSETFAKDVLKGNMFAFKDPIVSEFTQYDGSKTLNFSLVISVAMLLWSMFVIIESTRPVTRFTKFHEWSCEESENRKHFYKAFSFILFHCLISVILMFTITCSLKYGALRGSYSTHTYQYYWTWSAAFVHGVLPVVLFCSVLVVVTTLGGVSLLRRSADPTRPEVNNNRSVVDFLLLGVFHRANSAVSSILRRSSSLWGGSAGSTSPTQILEMRGTFVTFSHALMWVAADIAIWAAINYVYLDAFVAGHPRLTMIQVLVSFLTWLWNIFFPIAALYSLGWEDKRRAILFRYCVSLLNIIVLPLLMTSLRSSLCFLQLFEQNQGLPICISVNSSVIVDQSHNVTDRRDVCDDQASADASAATPPFIYSYQCSSALIVNYVPIYFYQLFISVSVSVFKLVVVPLCLVRLRSKENFWLQKQVRNLIPTVLYTDALQKLTETEIVSFKLRGYEWVKAFLPVEAITVQLVVTTGLFLTFGLAYPWLGFVIMLSLLSDLCSWMIVVGRFRSLLPADDYLSHRRTALVDDIVKYHMKTFRFGMVEFTVIVTVCFLFWSLLCYDMVTDVFPVSEWRKGVAAVVIIGLCCPSIVVTLVIVARNNGLSHPFDDFFAEQAYSVASRAASVESRNSRTHLMNVALLAGTLDLSSSVSVGQRSYRSHTVGTSLRYSYGEQEGL
jgi:hypothetical protein